MHNIYSDDVLKGAYAAVSAQIVKHGLAIVWCDPPYQVTLTSTYTIIPFRRWVIIIRCYHDFFFLFLRLATHEINKNRSGIEKIRTEDEQKINEKCPPEGLPVLILNYRKIINFSPNDRQPYNMCT